MINVKRRTLLTRTAGLATAAFFGQQSAFASVDEVTAAIDAFTKGVTPDSGVITLTTPEIAENGNSVPIAVSVDSPMTEDDHVVSVMLLAEDNPNPEIATFHFTPHSGQASASTRMRLAQTQNVVAVAKMSSGAFHSASNNIKVTIGGCGG